MIDPKLRIKIEVPGVGLHRELEGVAGVWRDVATGELVTTNGLEGLKLKLTDLGMSAYWWGVHEMARRK